MTTPAPQNLDAEEHVLGAIMLSDSAIDVVRAIVAPSDFYIAKHAKIYAAALELRERGALVDVVTLTQHLADQGVLGDVGGKVRIAELAHLVPAAGNAGHYAEIVREMSRRRDLIRVGHDLRVAGQNGGEITDDMQERLTAALRPPKKVAERFQGLSHVEVLASDVPAADELVAGIVEAGTAGTIAGLPETWKSWLAQQLAVKVAAGGTVLGRKVRCGPTGYWWQDDSRENELRRIQAYARRHDFTGDLPIRWHLNEGLALNPDGIGALRNEIERERQVLVVLDSLYNFLPGIKLKDEDVATVLTKLKAEVCDETGCAVCLVDHSPWPTEGNQSRRGYGSVFKAAVVRWGIYLDRKDDAVFIEARGNNLTGLTRTAAIWNADELELHLVQPTTKTTSDSVADRIDDFLRRNPGAATKVVMAGVQGNDTTIRERLAEDDRFQTVPPALFGKPRNTHCWARAEDVPDLLRKAK